MKICIYGAGAIGSHVGIEFGAEISLVARAGRLAAMRANALGWPRVGRLPKTIAPSYPPEISKSWMASFSVALGGQTC